MHVKVAQRSASVGALRTPPLRATASGTSLFQWRTAALIGIILGIVLFRGMHAGEMHTPLFSYASTHAEQHGIDALLGSLRAGLDAHEPEDPVAYLQGALQNMSSPKVIIAGAPASGKGTQCEVCFFSIFFFFFRVQSGLLLTLGFSP